MAFPTIQTPRSSTFLRQHDLVYESAPLAWDEGLPLGNGSIGAVVWGDGRPLVFTLGAYEIWDLREPAWDDPRYSYAHFKKLFREGRIGEIRGLFNFRHTQINPARLPGPRIALTFGATPTAYTARLDLARATASGRMAFGPRAAEWEAYIAAEQDLLVIRVHPGNHPKPAFSARLDHFCEAAQAEMKRRGMPPLREGRARGVSWLYQAIPENGGYLVAWREIAEKGNGSTFLLTLRKGEAQEELLESAAEFLRSAADDLRATRRRHLDYWRTYWSKSSLAIPDARLQSLYYAELYKFGCCSRPGKYPISLQGPWNVDGRLPDWHGEYACDMNVQLSYWPAYTSNRLDWAGPLYDWVEQLMPRFRRECKKFYGCEGAFTPGGIALNGAREYGWETCEQWPGNGPWIAWHFWLHYLYSRDDEFLKQRAYPVLRDFMRLYLGILEKGKDGLYHVPLSSSPEYSHDTPAAWGRDPSGDLALIRALGEALAFCVRHLHLDDHDAERRNEVLAHLAPYPSAATARPKLHETWEQQRFKLGMPNDPWLTELPARALFVMHEVPYYFSHPHLTHLLALYPLGLLTVEGSADEKQTVLDSIRTLWHFGMGRWAGQNMGFASCLASRAGMLAMALHMLQEYADHFISPNTFHVNGDYRQTGASAYTLRTVTLESGFAVAGAVMEMLLQSWGGKLRIFPGVSPEWKDAWFRDLRAEGAFLVSARRRAGKTAWVEIHSEKGGVCRVTNPFGDAPVTLEDLDRHERRTCGGGVLRFATRAGGAYRLYAQKPSEDDLRLRPVQTPCVRATPFGVKL